MRWDSRRLSAWRLAFSGEHGAVADCCRRRRGTLDRLSGGGEDRGVKVGVAVDERAVHARAGCLRCDRDLGSVAIHVDDGLVHACSAAVDFRGDVLPSAEFQLLSSALPSAVFGGCTVGNPRLTV